MRSLPFAIAALTVAVCQPAAAQGSVPYHDPSVAGHLAFCDSHGHLVTGGELAYAPVAAKVVSDYVPPSPYAGKDAGAYLLAFQPRQGVDPGNWSGEQLTTVSTWTDRRHPSVQLLPDDISLRQAAEDYPPHWDGLLQLRLFYTGPNAPVYQQKYAAADVRISQGRWSMVNPVNLACTSGTATADVVQLNAGRSAGHSASPPQVSSPSAAPTAGSGASGASGRRSPSPATSSAPLSPEAARSTDGGGTRAGVWWGLGALALVVVGTAGVLRRRLR